MCLSAEIKYKNPQHACRLTGEDDNKVGCQNASLKYCTMARDLLTQLRNISYEFDDAVVNKELFEALSPILQAADLKRQRENTLPLLPPIKRKSTLGFKFKPLSLNFSKNHKEFESGKRVHQECLHKFSQSSFEIIQNFFHGGFSSFALKLLKWK